MKNVTVNQIELLYLPENVTRKIFGYLNCEDLYLSLRRACKLLSKYVDNYIQVGGVFLLVTGATKQGQAKGNNLKDAWCFEDRSPCKIIYILNQNQKILSIIGETIPSLPNPAPQQLLFFSERNFKLQSCKEIACFGGLVKGRMIAGYLCKEYWEETEYGSLSRNKPRNTSVHSRYMIRYPIYKLIPYLYEYDRSRQLWIPITTLHTSLEPLIFTHDIHCTLAHCSAEESILLKLDIDSHRGNVCNNPRCYSKRNALVLFEFKTLTEENGSDEIKNRSSLHYKVKFLSIGNDFSKTINSDQQISLSKLWVSQGSVYAFSKSSGSVMYLREGGMQWNCDETLERHNYTVAWTPMLMDIAGLGLSSIRLYRSKGLMLQNTMCIVGAYPPTHKMAGGFSLGCNYYELACYRKNLRKLRKFAFSTESLYGNSTFHIYKTVTDIEESFSIMLTRIDYCNIYEKKNSELLLIILTGDLDPKHHLNEQRVDKNCVFHPGVYFDPTDISEASNSTLLRIS